MWKLLNYVKNNLIVAIPGSMLLGFALGLALPDVSVKTLIVPFTFMMVYPMMVTLKIDKVFEGDDVKSQILTQILNFAVIPFIAFGLGLIFFKDAPYLALGLLLVGIIPTSGMTISWTGFAKGNIEAAVKMTVVGLVLGAVATPFYVQYLMGAEIEVNAPAVAKQIVMIAFIPMLAGYATQRYMIRRFGAKVFKEKWGPKFPALSTVGVLGIVFVAMWLKAEAIVSSPKLLIDIAIPLLIVYAVNYTLSTVIGRLFLVKRDSIALVYGSVMRNLSIALAIAINAFGPQGSTAALVIAVAFVVQVQSAAWYTKFTTAIFGRD